MADEDEDSKTEEPTGKKLSDAQNKGQFAISNEVKIWTVLLGSIAIIGMFAPWIGGGVISAMAPVLEHAHAIPVDESSLGALLVIILGKMGLLLFLPMLMLLILSVASVVAQIGFVFNLSLIKFEFFKMNPISGLKRMVSMTALVELVKAILKVIVVSAVVGAVVWPRVGELELVLQMDLVAILDYLQDAVLAEIMAVLLLLTMVMAGDYFYQRFKYFKGLRMTRQEVKDENKQTEGDPMVKGRIRSLRVQRARQRMMAAVPQADVVVTNPTHYAVALKYDQETMDAPTVVAKGIDHLARKIRELAEEHDVPIVENPPLARALYATVELDKEVPPQHYKAVAEVISYVMRLKRVRV